MDSEDDCNVDILDHTDDQLNIAEDDDSIINSEEDRGFDDKLVGEVSQAEEISKEPEDVNKDDDDETEIDDSSIDDGYSSIANSQIDNSSPPDQPSIRPRGRGRGKKKQSDRDVQESPPPQISTYVGRGRLGKKALDASGNELPAPQILDAEPPQDHYTPAGKMARVPSTYYKNREDPSTQKERRANRFPSALIDFKTQFNEISIIIDKECEDEQGFKHASELLQPLVSNIEFAPSKPIYSIWSFGLNICAIKLPRPVSCNLLKLIPEIINDDKRPFWFMFKGLPKFDELKSANNETQKQIDPLKGILIRLEKPLYCDLSYGALTSMFHFYIHKDYIIRKKTIWTLFFRDEYFEIQANIFPSTNSSTGPNVTQIKYKVPIDIIDRVALFHLRNNGFTLFINMKGNVHELNRVGNKKKDEDKSIVDSFIRQGIRDNKLMPLFSTIRLRIQIKDDDSIMELIETSGDNKNKSVDEKKKLLEETREKSLIEICAVFNEFLNFFHKNRIHICFGAIASRYVALNQLATLHAQTFPTFIQSYSWVMLCNIGFRVQTQIYLSKNNPIEQLHKYSSKLHDQEDPIQTDDRFYRLCLYLHRRSSEYIFLNFDQEIGIGKKQYIAKYERSKKMNFQMVVFNETIDSVAYIPSVVITPTTIKIRPLKLCKLNRVLREKRFGGVLNFALVELRDEAQRLLFPSAFRSLKTQILKYLTEGISVTPSHKYKYLHHSQSQVKCKQFWFYYHDKEHGCLSHDDAYVWMGNFDKERVVAKHTARIALSFTSTDPSIRITADTVTYLRDIKDETKKYTFTDGVGTISTQLRDQIKISLRKNHDFSVLQIRYGGCKGTLSVDPRLDGQEYQLLIRDSMNKFTTDHDILEICKLSAPRLLYLNRQDIVLLESRDIPHTTFLRLQNEYHLKLIHSLLNSSNAYELLQEKLLPVFQLRNICLNIDITQEQFFMKLIITCAFNIIRELIDRTRIPAAQNKARNMFGVVDEYGVLEYGQVFAQFTKKSENKLNRNSQEEKEKEEEEEEEGNSRNKKDPVYEILQQKVVITKNPCHHPGDLRTFEAVDCPELRHLKDVIVFPQKGHRPHSNEISGSDLDGDEYVVIWDSDLVPQTENETPYDYDSQEDPPKMTRPINRDDINKIVMDISEQDCLGGLSNIHLAYADKYGITSEECTTLAGYISQEVDAAKTGKHPLTDEQIAAYRKKLDDKWPDFMKGRGKKSFYPSNRILGKLYRSARRAVLGWSHAISNHGNSKYIDVVDQIISDGNKEGQNIENNVRTSNNSLNCERPLDPLIFHENFRDYMPEIKTLYNLYRNELIEIIGVYRFQDEVDLFCRCESMDSSAGGSNKKSLEDSAAIEVQNLIRKISQDFYREFKQRNENLSCCEMKKFQDSHRVIIIDCQTCREKKMAKAACAYIYTYTKSNSLPANSNRRVLSFAWLFAKYLIKLRKRNLNSKNDQSNTIVSAACSSYLKNFQPKFKVFIAENSPDAPCVEFYYKRNEETTSSLLSTNTKSDKTIPNVPLLRACFIEILNDWLIKQEVFGDFCDEKRSKPLIPESIWHELMVHFLSSKYHENVRLVGTSRIQNRITERYREKVKNYYETWTSTQNEELQKMFDEIHSLAAQHGEATKSTVWSYLDEYIILALQCIGIEKELVDKWITPSKF